jgi:hypothetical protein
MYAILGLWDMDPAMREQQDAVLRERIVPGVAGSPGFVRGAWSREVGGERHASFITFEDEPSAREFMATVRANGEQQQANGVANRELVLVELVAEA